MNISRHRVGWRTYLTQAACAIEQLESFLFV
nr:MAG TPA: hypothetical protein [Caudoviricetes sp.]